MFTTIRHTKHPTIVTLDPATTVGDQAMAGVARAFDRVGAVLSVTPAPTFHFPVMHLFFRFHPISMETYLLLQSLLNSVTDDGLISGAAGIFMSS